MTCISLNVTFEYEFVIFQFFKAIQSSARRKLSHKYATNGMDIVKLALVKLTAVYNKSLLTMLDMHAHTTVVVSHQSCRYFMIIVILLRRLTMTS